MKFLGIALLITYGITLFYVGQEIMNERALSSVQQATAVAQSTLQKAQQREIDDFIRSQSPNGTKR